MGHCFVIFLFLFFYFLVQKSVETEMFVITDDITGKQYEEGRYQTAMMPVHVVKTTSRSNLEGSAQVAAQARGL